MFAVCTYTRAGEWCKEVVGISQVKIVQYRVIDQSSHENKTSGWEKYQLSFFKASTQL